MNNLCTNYNADNILNFFFEREIACNKQSIKCLCSNFQIKKRGKEEKHKANMKKKTNCAPTYHTF